MTSTAPAAVRTALYSTHLSPRSGIWRLLAQSEVDHYFTYASCAPFELTAGGCTRRLAQYQGTLLRPIDDGDRTFAQWSASYSCPPQDGEFWAGWWARSLPEWLGSLRDHLSRAHAR